MCVYTTPAVFRDVRISIIVTLGTMFTPPFLSESRSRCHAARPVCSCLQFCENRECSFGVKDRDGVGALNIVTKGVYTKANGVPPVSRAL